jgi:hypothetical protein
MKAAFDVATALVVVAGILVLVRPGSQGPAFVGAIGKSFAAALVAATGGWQGNPE